MLEWCNREQTEKQRSWERLLRAVTDVLDKPLTILDNQGHITLTNPEMARVLGASPESLIGIDFAALCDTETAVQVRSQIRKRQNVQANQAFTGGFTTSPGLRYPVVMRPIFNAEGVRDGFLLWIDVTTAMDGTLESGILFYVQQALHALPFPAQLINPAGRIVAQNPAAEHLLEHGDNVNPAGSAA